MPTEPSKEAQGTRAEHRREIGRGPAAGGRKRAAESGAPGDVGGRATPCGRTTPARGGRVTPTRHHPMAANHRPGARVSGKALGNRGAPPARPRKTSAADRRACAARRSPGDADSPARASGPRGARAADAGLLRHGAAHTPRDAAMGRKNRPAPPPLKLLASVV